MSVFRDDIVKDRVALVTGGGTGIGKEIARTLARHGARLAIASRRQEVLEAAREEFEAEGFECLAVPCDVRRSDEVERVMQEILRRYGRLDIVVHNAGVGRTAPRFEDLTDAQLVGRTPGFRDLDPAVLEALLAKATRRRIGPGETLFEVGQAFLDEVYIVRLGEVELQRPDGRLGSLRDRLLQQRPDVRCIAGVVEPELWALVRGCSVVSSQKAVPQRR